jgi:hypothetical protein
VTVTHQVAETSAYPGMVLLPDGARLQLGRLVCYDLDEFKKY